MKSHEKDLLKLAAAVLQDAAAKCANVNDISRDVKTITSRVKHEGLSFLTITLPDFGKDIEGCLADNYIPSTRFRSFKKRGKAPAFMQGFFRGVFDVGGKVKNEVCISSLEALRQVANTFKKLKLSCTPEREAAAVANYHLSEAAFNEPLDEADLADFLAVSKCLWSEVFRWDDPIVGRAIPKHGPGATQEKLSGNAKFRCTVWHDRLEPYFPFYANRFSSESAYGSMEAKRVNIMSEGSEEPAMVHMVPKTLKAPRVIVIEPVCMMYSQQALMEEIIILLSTHRWTAGQINFADQSVNRELAITSSRTLEWATLDMSDASNLVPLRPAINMFDSNPDLRDAVSACRSKRAQLPSGEVIKLKKFASMGSALCFPVEAMYFYTICVMSLLKKYNLPVSHEGLDQVCSRVFVYGDDIVVPTNDALDVMDSLQKYYCKVNVHKSFYTGKFRESCGMDAYDGEEVTPTYLRTLAPHCMRDQSELLSWLASSNLFYKKGYWRTAAFLQQKCEAIMGPLPVVGEKSDGLGVVSYQRGALTRPNRGKTRNWRWNKQLQRYEFLCWVDRPVFKEDPLNGYDALTKALTSMERRPDLGQARPVKRNFWAAVKLAVQEAELLGTRDVRSRAGVTHSIQTGRNRSIRDQRGLAVKAAYNEKEYLSWECQNPNSKHLTHSARYGTVALKRRWVRPY